MIVTSGFLLALLSLTCYVDPIEGYQYKYNYLIGPTSSDGGPPVDGWLFVACLKPPCLVLLALKQSHSAMRINRKTVMKRLFTARTNSTLHGQRVASSSDQITVMASIPLPSDPTKAAAFSVYPVFHDHTLFIATLAKHVDFIYILARDGDTKVTVTNVPDEFDNSALTTRHTVQKDIGYLLTTRDFNPLTEPVVRTNRPVALYFIFGKTLRGSIPPLRNAGREFLFGTMRNDSYMLNVFATTCTELNVTVLKEDGQSTYDGYLHQLKQDPCLGFCQPILKYQRIVNGTLYKVLKISSTHDVTVHVYYYTVLELNINYLSRLSIDAALVVPPITEFTFQYFVRKCGAPVNERVVEPEVEPQVVVFVKAPDGDTLSVNGLRLNKFVKKVGGRRIIFRVSDKEVYHVYTGLRFKGRSKTLHFTPRAFAYQKPKFGVLLLDPNRPINFITAVGTYSHHRDKPGFDVVSKRIDGNCSHHYNVIGDIESLATTSPIDISRSRSEDSMSEHHLKLMVILIVLSTSTLALVGAIGMYSLYKAMGPSAKRPVDTVRPDENEVHRELAQAEQKAAQTE